MSAETAHQVVVYTRAGCHLCDDAEQLLRAAGLVPRMVDIDADETLQALHTDWVPVVEIDGVVRFRGRIEPVLLRRLLAGDS
ncbi:MAG: glutaredoxin family protein [Planctomycetales bacterium]|nr:glutaredoxin family protein [Planctomycetales bacterium]MBN8627961.1 glutaredoxin family protein [Planctomycetota bacterium]